MLNRKTKTLPTDSFELNEATIDELQQKMQSGKYTSRSITEMYLKRIEAIDKNGPKLNSVIELNPDALMLLPMQWMQNERQVKYEDRCMDSCSYKG